jgi:type IV pilus assembly protein PilC
MPACLRTLAADLEAERRERMRLWQTAAYPLLLLHLVVPAASTPLLLTHPRTFATRVVVAIAGIWGVLAAAVWLHRRGLRSAAYVRTLNALPLVGAILRASAFTRYFRSLAELYGSGVRIQEALDAARAVVGPVPPVDDFALAASAARAGAPMAASFAAMRSLDPPLRALLETAATTGTLEGALRRAVADLEERWRSLALRLVTVATSALYAIAVVVVAWTILSFYTGYFSQYDEYERHLKGR